MCTSVCVCVCVFVFVFVFVFLFLFVFVEDNVVKRDSGISHFTSFDLQGCQRLAGESEEIIQAGLNRNDMEWR